MSDRREYVRPKLGEPVIVHISCAQAEEVKTDKGETEYLYSLNHNKAIMYASRIGHQAIQKSGAQQGDTIRILREYGKWNVEVCEDEPAGRPDSALPKAPPQNGNGNAYREPAARRAFAPPDVQAAATRAANMPETPRTVYPLADNFIPFLRSAAIACTEISREAASQGHKLEFSTRDMAAIASTLFIQYAKGTK